MIHRAAPEFWSFYEELPTEVQELADKAFTLLKANAYHPSLHFKKLYDDVWSVRIGAHYRALGNDLPDGVIWVWIGTHAEYNRLTRKS